MAKVNARSLGIRRGRSYNQWTMPAQITHMIAGEEALKRASPSYSAALSGIDESIRWFRMGCQGPDIFYHNQRTQPSGLHYGSLAHRREFGAIVEGAFRNHLGTDGRKSRITECPPLDPAFAWLLGFATHAALDRILHPFIVWFSGWHDPARPETSRFRACHPFLERILDLVYLERSRGLAGADLDLEALLPLDGRAVGDRESPEVDIAGILMVGLARAFPQAAASDFLLGRRIANAIMDARYFLRVTNPSRTSADDAEAFTHFDDRQGRRSIAIVYPLALSRNIDFANEAGSAWEHPAGDGRHYEASFFELVEDGICEASRVISLLLEEEAHPRLPDGGMTKAVGIGGLSITDAEGNPTRPRVCDPLPLPELMEAEFALRLDRARKLLN